MSNRMLSTESRRRSHRVVGRIVTLAAIAILLAIAGCRSRPGGTLPVATVTVAHPVIESVSDYIDLTGNTVAVDSVTLVARVEGYLDKIHFDDGAMVKKGNLLFTIQQQQYKYQLQQAVAQVATQKAAVFHATTELARYKHLEKQRAATQTEVDHWQYEHDASVAALSSAEAQVDLARLNLSYTEVRAPFDGRMGRHLVNPGNLVGSPGSATQLAQINRLDPMYIYFTVNETELLRIRRRAKAPSSAVIPAEPVPFFFGLSDEEGYSHQGRLDFASISVAPTTGTLQMRGIFSNPGLLIVPGLFVRVRVVSPAKHPAPLVPAAAVNFDQLGEYVLVVDDKNVVRRRAVKTGNQVGDKLVIDEGLSVSDRVVVDGLLQAIPGRVVNPEMQAPGKTPT